MIPPFETTYRSYAKKTLKVEPDVVDVPGTGIKGFWLGDKKTATHHMIYFHGGGFVIAGLDPHLEMLGRFIKWSGNRLAVFCPCYTLSPAARYPQAIKECAEAVKYVYGLGKEVLLGGDSAGGNLVCAMLSLIGGHKLEDGFELEVGKVKGALAIAPWVSSDKEKFPGMVPLNRIDLITTDIAKYWYNIYKGDRTKDDEFLMAELAASEWWQGCKGKVGSVLAVAGGDEVLRDPIKSWYGKFEKGFGGESRLVVGPGEVHDAPLNPGPEETLGRFGEKETQEGAIKRWIEEITK